MGRGVSYATGSVLKSYYDISHMYDKIEGQNEIDWECFVEDLVYDLKKKYKSLNDCDEWVGREDHAILENSFVYFGLSEYCGTVCLWVVMKNIPENHYSLANTWMENIRRGFYKDFGTMVRQGTMSNGVSVYTKK